jgi:methyltransferase (TIGR00027 family)
VIDRASHTAERVARRRAAHQLIDDPRVLVDPIALTILGSESEAALRADPHAENDSSYGRMLRAFLVARSRVAEDEVAAAHERGIRQYVVLGAGLDTFAYRNPFPDLQVVEIDHPATQAMKRARLAAAGIEVPANVVYLPVDFANDDLTHALAGTPEVRADARVFSWLGVSIYLERTAVSATLRAVAGAAGADGAVVFDYAAPLNTLSLVRRAAISLLMQRLEAIGEPWRTFIEPSELADELTGFGFRSVTDFSADALNAKFFDSRTDGLRVGGIGHVLVARKT